MLYFIVLGSFLKALNAFVAEEYFAQHHISEFHVYDFTKVTGLTELFLKTTTQSIESTIFHGDDLVLVYNTQ